MPQLDLAFYFSQAFWLIITYALSFLLMHFVIVPKARKILDKRQKLQDDNNYQIETLMSKIEDLKLHSAKQRSKIEARVEELKEEYNVKFNKHYEHMISEFNAKIKHLDEITNREIREQLKVLDDVAVEKHVKSIAERVILKLVGEKL